MSQQLLEIAFVLIGLIIGALGLWLFMRGRIESAVARANNETQIEITRLTERLSGYGDENRRIQIAAQYHNLFAHWRAGMIGAFA